MPHFPIILFDFMEVRLPTQEVRFLDGESEVISTLPNIIGGMKKPQLHVKIRATTSGKLINKRCYPGPHMRDSVHTWTKNYGKPILDDHPSRGLFGGGSDPTVLGRVNSATYFKTCSDEHFMNDWRNPDPHGGGEGSGHTIVGGVIGDRNAIEAVMDGRLLTVSQGSVPDRFFCSVCEQDWVDSGPCEHEAMKTYEIDEEGKQGKFLAFGVTGLLDYDHLAYINSPADVTAQTLEAELRDSVNAELYFPRTDELTPGILAQVAVFDAASRRCLEMDLKAIKQAQQLPLYDKLPSPLRPKLEAVVDLTDALSKERAMSKKTNDQVEDPKNEDPPAEKPGEGETEGEEKPKDEPTETPEETHAPAPEAPPAEEGDAGADEGDEGDAEAEGGEGDTNEPIEEGEGGGDSEPKVLRLSDSGNWTMPDPEDGHTHKLTQLNADGTGMVAKAKGHDHEVVGFRVMPRNQDGGTLSRHPGTWFIDESGDEPVVKLLSDGNDEGEGLAPEQYWPQDELEAWELTEIEDVEEEWKLYHDGVLKDAPLTTKQRKNLSASQFCGPNRSFPVNDPPRIRNALARLGQGNPKGASAGSKARILACVKRAAKRHGIKVSEGSGKGSADRQEQVTPTVLQTLSSEIDRLKADKTRLEAEVSEQSTEIKALKTQTDQLATEKREMLVDRVADMMLMLRKPEARDAVTQDKIKEFKTKLLERSVDSLQDKANDLQLELAEGSGSGVRPGLGTEPPKSPVGALGGAPKGSKSPEGGDFKKAALSRLQ